MNAKEIKNRLKAISFNFEDSDGVTHIPWVDLQEALDVIDAFEAKSKEESEERYDKAIDYMNDISDNHISWLQKSKEWLIALRLAAFGKEGEG